MNQVRSLVVSDISKRFENSGGLVAALHSVSLSIRAGQVVAVLGRNGAGKSTLMSIIAGVVTADSGQVAICGEDESAALVRAPQRLGFAPQRESIYPLLTVRENFEYFGRLAGLRRAELSRRVDVVARDLQLSQALDIRCSTLSGGKRRRVHIGLALMHEPAVLLLDEPTVGVDLDARFDLLEFVRTIAAQGRAVLYSTHHLTEVEALGADLLVMDFGRAIFEGSVAQLVTDFAPPMVELEFSAASVALPSDLVAALDEECRTDAGGLRIVARLADVNVAIADVIEVLSASARERLVAASIIEPGLEPAYRRFLRLRGGQEAERLHGVA